MKELKRTEVCWLVKRTFKITIRPFSRCISQFYFITIDLHSITLKDKTDIFQSKIINVYQQNINKNF